MAEAVAPPVDDPALPNSSFILAEKRTHRRDPLDDFKYYNGGWNISNKHYWASVGFTAVALFVISIIWFMGFGLVLLLIGCYVCCCRRRNYSYSWTCYALSLILLILFTCAAIIGCVLLYNAQAKAYESMTGTLDYVVDNANITVENLRNFSTTLSAAKRAGVNQVLMPADVQGQIDEIQTRINASANDLTYRVDDNSDKIQNVLDNVRLDLIIIAAVMLFLAFLGFWKSLPLEVAVSYIYLLLILWFFCSVLNSWSAISCLHIGNSRLVSSCWDIYTLWCISSSPHVSADTCVSMNEWVSNPTSHTALDDILPCVDVTTANSSLYQSKESTFSLVNVINQVINNVSNGNFPPLLGPPLYFNQSGPLMPVLCNPFNADMTDRECKTGEVGFNNASQVWEKYLCNVSSAGVCTTVGRATPDIYNQMTSAATVSYGLYQYTPFLINLEDCTFVRDTFKSISEKNCPGLRKYSRHIYVGLVMVSSGVMLSLVFWVIYARERRHRKYNKQFIQS